MNNFEAALTWWFDLSESDKARYLQCAATPAQIDAALRSRDPLEQSAAAIAAVGDAWNAWRAYLRALERNP